MAKNIFEELVEETGKILGNSFRIRAEAKGCDFCFKDLKKEKIRESLQETISFVITDTELKLKKFIFEEKEIKDIHSLTLVLVRLTCAGLNSLNPEKKDQIESVNRLSECRQCQETLLDTLGHFTGRLVRARKKWRRPFLRFFKNLFRLIFGPKKRDERPRILIGIDAVLPVYLPLLSLLLRSKLFLNSEEKWEIIQKYLPLFKEKEIGPEKVIDTLAKATQEKKQDLEPEEFEKALKDLLEIK